MRHRKIVGLSDRTFRVWIELLDAASEQKTRGCFQSYAEAAAIIRRKPVEVRQVAAAGLMDDTADGLVEMHDWKDWQRWLSEESPSNDSGITNESHTNNTNKTRERPTKTQTLARAREEVDVDGEGDREEELTSIPPVSPRGGRRVRQVLTESDRQELIEKWAERFGSEGAVTREIDVALNHTASAKAKSEKLYVDTWLRRELEFSAKRRGKSDTTVWAADAFYQREDGECSCAQRKEWLKVNRNSNPFCAVHGDVRDLAAGGAA